jgi:hypothetical protein
MHSTIRMRVIVQLSIQVNDRVWKGGISRAMSFALLEARGRPCLPSLSDSAVVVIVHHDRNDVAALDAARPRGHPERA